MKFNTTTVMLAMMLMVAWLVGCTDVPSTAPPPISVDSEFRFLNAATDLASVDISFDQGPAATGLAFGQPNSHVVYPSGNRVGVASSGDTLRIAMTTDQRGTLVILPLTSGFREVVKLIERRVFDPATTATARIRVVHAAVDSGAAGPAVDVTLTGTDTTLTFSGLSYKQTWPSDAANNVFGSYLAVPAGSYTLDVFAAGDTNAVMTTTIDAATSRYTSVITGDLDDGTAAFVNMADD